MLVIDASITIAWILPDEHSDLARTVRDRVLAEGAVVPSIWTLEVTNILVMAQRRARTDAASVTQALALLQQLPVTVVPGSLDDFDAVAAAARDHKLTAYDAAYLALARREGLPLATLDRELAAAAKAVGVAVVTA